MDFKSLVNDCALVTVIIRKAIKRPYLALDGVVQWIEYQPANQSVAVWIPSQGTCLGCRLGPQLGVCERQPHIDVSLSLPPFLSL